MASIYFVRHGQSEWNVTDQICGATDIPLTAQGRAQARETGEKIRELGIPEESKIQYTPDGKPFLAGGPAFSLSHSGEHVLLGVSDQPIGVDMERSGRQVPEAVRRRICLPGERELDPLQVFTRKECAMKLTGQGFSLPLGDIDTTRDYRWQERDHRFFTVEQEGYVISVLSAEKDLPEIQLLTPEELL